MVDETSPEPDGYMYERTRVVGEECTTTAKSCRLRNLGRKGEGGPKAAGRGAKATDDDGWSSVFLGVDGAIGRPAGRGATALLEMPVCPLVAWSLDRCSLLAATLS